MSLRSHALGLYLLHIGLSEDKAGQDPVYLFKRWFRAASRWGCFMPNAMALSTCDSGHRPSSRMVLLKGHSTEGFVFYTHYPSRKGLEIEAHPHASLLFHWNELFRQIRIEGRVEKISEDVSDAYFASRMRGSQTGAWASHQSHPLHSRADLEAAVRAADDRFRGRSVPRPPYWGGYRVVPEWMEFWQGRAFRLHDRLVYRRTETGWTRTRLYP